MKSRSRHPKSGVALAVGAVGVVASAIACVLDRERFFAAWLISWFFWFSIAMGCLGFSMIHTLSGGRWGRPLGRILGAAGRTFGLLALLFVPLFFGIHKLYPWARPEVVSQSEKLQHKHAYLNLPFWCIRAVFYFACWYVLSLLLSKALSRQGRGDSETAARRLSAGGLVAIFLTVSFASFDWLMSLEPLWYSSVYGLIVIAGQGISGMAFALLAAHWLGSDAEPSDKVLKDLGNLLLTACSTWMYVAFVQWLIAWIGNVPETVTWYVARARHGWQWVAWAVVIAQFVIPFQLLLFQRFKTRTRNLAALSCFVLLFRLLDIQWLVVPALHPDAPTLDWMILPAMAAIGGLWMALFARRLSHE